LFGNHKDQLILSKLKPNKNNMIYRLYKKDARICKIPITTYGVTVAEVERIHFWLSTCWFKCNEGEQDKN